VERRNKVKQVVTNATGYWVGWPLSQQWQTMQHPHSW